MLKLKENEWLYIRQLDHKGVERIRLEPSLNLKIIGGYIWDFETEVIVRELTAKEAIEAVKGGVSQ